MDNPIETKIMPHSIEAEQSVIGAMLMDAEAIDIASEMLKEEDFYARQYGVLFVTIVDMHRKRMGKESAARGLQQPHAHGPDQHSSDIRQHQDLREDRRGEVEAQEDDPGKRGDRGSVLHPEGRH